MSCGAGQTLLRVVVLALLAAAASAAHAHRLRPAVATVGFDGAGGFEVAVQANVEVLLAGIGPQHRDTSESDQAPEYDALRRLPPGELRARFDAFSARFLAALEARFDGQPVALQVAGVAIPAVGDVAVPRVSVVRLRGAVPAGAREFAWRYPPEFGDCALRIADASGEVLRSEWLTGGAASEPFPLAPGLVQARSGWRVALDYTRLGFTHILPGGLDHVLFVLGIFLLSLRWRPLLYQVTAFTVAHSITLALALYGVVSLPAAIVEPLIALSIVYVAGENLVSSTLRPWRVWVVFGFGLLHGLGFAGVLSEIGLPREEYVTALVAFNVGVELGQLAVIGLAFLAVGAWFRHRAWYRRAIVVPGSLAIAATGAYWTVLRLAP